MKRNGGWMIHKLPLSRVSTGEIVGKFQKQGKRESKTKIYIYDEQRKRKKSGGKRNDDIIVTRNFVVNNFLYETSIIQELSSLLFFLNLLSE